MFFFLNKFKIALIHPILDLENNLINIKFIFKIVGVTTEKKKKKK